MDAKPQRPLKSLRGGGDENVVKPELLKYKSTGNLNSAGDGLRVAAKRTAFHDLSNTNKIVGKVAQDDSEIMVKGYEVKKVQVASTTLQNRPAMRSGIANHIKATQDIPTTKQVQSNKVLAVPGKRNPIFKDSENQPIIVKDQDKQVAVYAGQTYPDYNYDNLSLLNGRPVGRPVVFEDYNAKEHSKASKENRISEAAAISEKEDQTNEFHESYMRLVNSGLTNDDSLVEPDGQVTCTNQVSTMHWELEEEDEQDGYTTAHSFVKGDNTTGGITGVIFPQFTHKIREELEEAAEIVENTKSQDDIEDEAWDITMVAEYGEDIFSYMRDLDHFYLAPVNYMDIQGEIQWSMRAVLMDWMVQVHARFGLLPETLYLCVNCIDRFLALKVVSLGKLQLVGATALFIAAKYEEINCPSIAEVVYMVDGGYNADEILKAERFMLSMLGFQLGAPGPLSFLRRISKADEYDLATRTLAKYFMELTIMDERFVGIPASFIAAGAHALSRCILKKGDWTPHHVHYSGYVWDQIQPLAILMLQCCENAQQHHHAVFEKFSDKRYKRASVTVQNELAKGVNIPGHRGTFHCFGTYVPAPNVLATRTYHYRP